ncbi:hypothetical protein J1N35_006883 [Gossypium stocksii]|uniref:Uncharacterized protein n=1 Tax=Gossypium stocksii TaxID=47602 RepID=A0A9D4AF36_9ROSI|nr:hypothetical protein J1N35_006883 [Gossypium stocksii]
MGHHRASHRPPASALPSTTVERWRCCRRRQTGGGRGWISRNEKAFEGKVITLDSLIYQTKLRLFVWATVVCEECIFTESDWWGWPRKSSLVKRVGNVRIMDWEPPPCGWMKFNVAGVSLDERAGCPRGGGGCGTRKGLFQLYFQVTVQWLGGFGNGGTDGYKSSNRDVFKFVS